MVETATLAIHDPPYNFVAFQERDIENFISWSQLGLKIHIHFK